MKKSLALLLTLLLAACGNPHNVAIPADGKLDTIANDLKKLPMEEQKALLAYIIRKSLGQSLGGEAGIPPGTTVGQALADQTQWEAGEKAKAAEAAALKAKVEAAKAALLKQVDNTLTVALVSLKLTKAEFSQNVHIEIALHNKSDKPITGVKGMVKFYDGFGDQISTSAIKIEDPIKPGSDLTWTGERQYNEFDADDRKLASADPAKVKLVFEPEAILFADGSSLKVAQ